MSVIAIGDIHGQCVALRGLLAQILPEMRPADTLVFLGDYIDRGPDSKGCVEEILRLKSDSRFKIVTLMGNHEQWMLQSLHDPTKHGWLISMEALETISSYSEEVACHMAKALLEHGTRLFTLHLPLPYCAFFDAMPRKHLDFFQQLEAFYAEAGIVCAHAGIDLEGNTTSADMNCFVWGPSGFPEEYSATEAVIYGHHNNAVVSDDGSIQPCIGANKTFGIDTISHGVLTALRLPEGDVFQSPVKTAF
jgi:serine/threonine protein phosphatase 1